MLHGAFAAFASEFPNDNADLHLGTIWMCEDLCGPAEAHLPPERSEVLEDEARVDSDDEESIEIVDSIELEGPIEHVPAPVESGVMALLCEPEEDGPCADDEPPAPLVSTPPPPLRDSFEAFLQTLSDVACDAGHTFAASEIGAALEGDAVALAWRAILNGESEDFSLCATPLDEWASVVLARILSAPHKAGNLRRELRARGVAAFGLVEAA